MRVVDAFCGTGGFSAGAVAAGCEVVLGIDSCEIPLRLWKTNIPTGRSVCASIGSGDAVDWPEAADDLHVHFSPACTDLSQARTGGASKKSVENALEMVRWCLRLVIAKGYTSFSLENVAAPSVRAAVDEIVRAHPDSLASVVLDAADFGTPSNRVRLIVSTPKIVQRLKQMPVTRVSIRTAFKRAGVELPARFLKSNTSNRDGTACVRSVKQQAFCVIASHPHVWCDRSGKTMRCLKAFECAILMGFPSSWQIPKGSRAGIRAVGNAVPPPLAQAVMKAASMNDQPPPPLTIQTTINKKNTAVTAKLKKLKHKLRKLARRVAVLERHAVTCDQ